jgi:hypothetical protein
MPNFKISQLTTATAVSATNQFEINQNAASRSLEVSVLSTYIRSGDSGKAIVVSVSTASDAVRITQTGTGNALVVEDSTNPDSSPFVVDASGNVGVGTGTPTAKLDIGSGNLSFTSTGQRITGDFSNGTQSNRVFFQTTTAGGGTSVGTIPNATGVNSAFNAFGGPDPGNASFAQLRAGSDTSDVRLTSGINGTGTYYPMTFYTGGSERMRLDTSGNVGIGTTSTTANAKLAVEQGIVARASTAGLVPYLQLYNSNAGTDLKTWRFGGDSAGSLSIETVNDAYSAAVQRLVINSSGNVGIGTSSPSAYGLTVSKASGAAGMQIASGANNSDFVMSGTDLYIANNVAGTIQFYINSAERARITAGGRIGIKTSVPTSLLTISTPGDTENITKLTINGYGDFRGYGCIMQPNNDTNCVPFLFTNAAGTIVGSISTNASGTSFTTSSDYRLKHDVQPLTTGLATIAALKPSTYKWNADDSHGEGFIAHELAEHIPHAVTGEKDAVNADGSIKPQAVDYSKIVVHLVAALQGLKAESDALKARIATLEARQ